jgi:hypothetical protein
LYLNHNPHAVWMRKRMGGHIKQCRET